MLLYLKTIWSVVVTSYWNLISFYIVNKSWECFSKVTMFIGPPAPPPEWWKTVTWATNCHEHTQILGKKKEIKISWGVFLITALCVALNTICWAYHWFVRLLRASQKWLSKRIPWRTDFLPARNLLRKSGKAVLQ